jgi:hypothetical protein
MSTVKKPLKKGNSSWKPASVTDVIGKEDGYRYRWINKDADNLAKKKAEGWETLNGLQADGVTPTDSNKIEEGQKMTSIYEKRDVILARLPEETALERDAYFNDMAENRVKGLTAHIERDAASKGVAVHGNKITISSRKGTQTYE